MYENAEGGWYTGLSDCYPKPAMLRSMLKCEPGAQIDASQHAILLSPVPE
jgi:hypothetical protein